MRWHHPILGMIPPVQFIPIAEELGLIVSMGKWALEKACADALAWQKHGLPEVLTSVNLSPRQFESRTLIADIKAALESSGLDPSLLELEITESAMMADPEHAVTLLRTIRDMGVGLAIDDFDGYSSPSYLKHFPLSTVKIDRAFINDLAGCGRARAHRRIITLAHGLRMKVVAEGVETPVQFNYLHSRGCDEAQGYWGCKPVPADEARISWRVTCAIGLFRRWWPKGRHSGREWNPRCKLRPVRKMTSLKRSADADAERILYSSELGLGGGGPPLNLAAVTQLRPPLKARDPCADARGEGLHMLKQPAHAAAVAERRGEATIHRRSFV